MSNLHKPIECAEWIAAWEKESPGRSHRWIHAAYVEQYHRLTQDLRGGLDPEGPEAVRRTECVHMLDHAEKRAAERLRVWDAEHDAKAAANQRAAKEALAAAAARYPKRF